jgi:hypothetical protein
LYQLVKLPQAMKIENEISSFGGSETEILDGTDTSDTTMA